MNVDLKLLIAVVSAFTALFVSIVNIYLTKRKITSDTFPKFRYKRLEIIKKAIDNFLDIYFEKPDDRNKLQQAIIKIELMFNYKDTPIYNGLKRVLYKYLESSQITDHKPLIKETQTIFNWIMTKAKLEAGITSKVDEKYHRILYRKFSKCKGCNYNCDRPNLYSRAL